MATLRIKKEVEKPLLSRPSDWLAPRPGERWRRARVASFHPLLNFLIDMV
jgi:hypothetical protein